MITFEDLSQMIEGLNGLQRYRIYETLTRLGVLSIHLVRVAEGMEVALLAEAK